MEFEQELSINETNIPGLLVLDLSVHGDNRGWFKENFQRAKMVALGLPDIKVVQNNISFNAKRGTTRGIHAEPWDKYISLASGSVFGAWVDLREGDTFGEVFTCVLDPSKAIFVPRGVGNSFQALEDDTAYTYLVNAHWSLTSKKYYTFVNVADPELDIQWPIPLEEAELSEADKGHPLLKNIEAMQPKKTLLIGANGQLGRALRAVYDETGKPVDCVDIDTFDISDPNDYEKLDWASYGTVINAGAFTAVDAAETEEGRIAAWKANATGPALLAKMAVQHDFTLVHFSSDYVFDGNTDSHSVREPFSPLSVYGQTKAAGDLAVSVAPKHYIVRTSWVIGDGRNFVRTMMGLSDRCKDESDALDCVEVVDDQFGRLAFTEDLASFTASLVDNGLPYGTYNFSNPGKVASWYEIACKVFDLKNRNAEVVKAVSTDAYDSRCDHIVAPRPRNSALEIDDALVGGTKISDWEDALSDYVHRNRIASK